MPRTTASISQASSSRAQSSQPTCEQREILYETTFDVNKDFKNFEATQWAVQEFTRRGLKKLFKPVTTTAYTKLVVQFYSNLHTESNKRGVLFSKVKGQPVEVTTADIAAALKCNDDHPPVGAQMDAQPEPFYMSQIIDDMCGGQYADNKNNAGSRSKLPPQLWLVDSILYRNVCPLGHKTQRRDPIIQALYAFYKGHWYSIPSIIWDQMNKFWEGVIWKKTTTTNSWGLPFPFLLTHIMKKKGIKGTPEDGPVTEHPFFGRNQWNHSQSHMPRGIRAPVPVDEGLEDAEHMEVEEPAAQHGGEGEPVGRNPWNRRIKRLEQSIAQLAKRFDTQEEMLRAILNRLPPVPEASSSAPPGDPQ
jgi:hypothetical protein